MNLNRPWRDQVLLQVGSGTTIYNSEAGLHNSPGATGIYVPCHCGLTNLIVATVYFTLTSLF
jgi:hypothetical protein